MAPRIRVIQSVFNRQNVAALASNPIVQAALREAAPGASSFAAVPALPGGASAALAAMTMQPPSAKDPCACPPQTGILSAPACAPLSYPGEGSVPFRNPYTRLRTVYVECGEIASKPFADHFFMRTATLAARAAYLNGQAIGTPVVQSDATVDGDASVFFNSADASGRVALGVHVEVALAREYYGSPFTLTMSLTIAGGFPNPESGTWAPGPMACRANPATGRFSAFFYGYTSVVDGELIWSGFSSSASGGNSQSVTVAGAGGTGSTLFVQSIQADDPKGQFLYADFTGGPR